MLWEKEKAYYCSCRKLVSNPQDAEIAAESWMEQGDPKLQPTSHGIFPNVAARETLPLPQPHREAKSDQSSPPKTKDEKCPFFGIIF